MWRCLALAAACTGCAQRTVPLHNDGTSAPKPTACLRGAELTALARKVWKTGAQEEVTSLECTPVRRKGASLWWIEAQVGEPWVHALVSADDSTVLWSRRDEPVGIGIEHRDGGTADFDGDGNDEIWMVQLAGEGGASGTTFLVIDIAKEPVEMQVQLGWMNDAGEHECVGDYKLIRRGARQLIEVTRKGNACTADDKPHEVYERRGNELVPAAP